MTPVPPVPPGDNQWSRLDLRYRLVEKELKYLQSVDARTFDSQGRLIVKKPGQVAVIIEQGLRVWEQFEATHPLNSLPGLSAIDPTRYVNYLKQRLERNVLGR